MTLSIAFVGAGPTTIYTLCAFLKAAAAGAEITIFEEQGRAGLGMPYRPGWNDPAMLSNIASVEIPPIEETLIAWLGRQPRARLVRLGIDPDTIDDHAFYPRLALGEYFLEKFTALIHHARERGVAIDVRTRACVTDIVAEGERLRLQVTPAHGPPFEQAFDRHRHRHRHPAQHAAASAACRVKSAAPLSLRPRRRATRTGWIEAIVGRACRAGRTHGINRAGRSAGKRLRSFSSACSH